MTNENKTKNTTDNKALFGPLGKYAIVAVIMVSIIVTTAMMLDKQLNNVEQEFATLEKEVTDIKTADSETTTSTPVEKATTTTRVEDLAVEMAETEISEGTNEKDVTILAANEEADTEQTGVEKTAEIEQTEQTSSAEAVVTETTASEVVESEMATDDSKSVKANRSQRNMENKARIAANKLEQKQRLSNQFARINKRELQQLEQYKINQDKRIVRLREQNKQQGHIIDALIVRNHELATIRKVNIQKHQTNREQILNRI